MRTETHKLTYFCKPVHRDTEEGRQRQPHIEPYWELYDLTADPNELHNVYDDPDRAEIQRDLHAELDRLQTQYDDTPLH